MKIGVIGDDFTGSSDIANTLARAGARTLQYAGIPKGGAAADIDAAVISLKSRSIPPGEAVVQSLTACRWLLAQGAEQIVFKYCSTFDSTPDGNIGPVAEALLDELREPYALVCPAFPANGRTVYQGHLFVHDQLLSESGLENHPLTPMTDPDIRRWLSRQTPLRIGHLPLDAVRSGRLPEALAACLARGERLIVADAIADQDLLALGVAAARHRLVTGGSAVAAGLPANFGMRKSADAGVFPGNDGPGLILSGSCSAATRRQVAAYSARSPALLLAADDAVGNTTALRQVSAFLRQHRDHAPLIYSTVDPDQVLMAQARFGRDRLAAAFEKLFVAIALAAIETGFRRLVVAGGETSGAVAGALGPVALQIGPEIAPGVPALRMNGEPGLALALKSGNFGDDAFFGKALAVLGGAG